MNLTCRNWTAVGVPNVDLMPIVDLAFGDAALGRLVVGRLGADGRWTAPSSSQCQNVEQHLDVNDGLAVVTRSQSRGASTRGSHERCDRTGAARLSAGLDRF